ncbi:MAG: extracellular solute-binding protein [Candidatus Colwellbacteria bacterium]|nr:extracellular solute-binding protein [Candidatus Colwellbacteria bacterium]
MPQLNRKQIIILGAIGLAVIIVLLILIGILPGRRSGSEVSLELWGIDDKDAWKSVINNFEQLYPEVSVNYTEVTPGSYEEELLNALAAGRGPDVFMFKSTWLLKHRNKIYPAQTSKISPETVSSLFPQVVEDDFIADNRVYALPLSVDTLAIVYNRDIFDGRGLALPPKTWSEFEAAVSKLRTFTGGNLISSGASLGASSGTVPNAPDILSLLLLERDILTIDVDSDRVDLTSQTAEEALRFYLKFADPESSVYAWNNSFGNSIEALASEKTAMVFAYSDEIPEIRERNPQIDLGISAAPQFNLSNSVNYAKYWGLAVSATSVQTTREAAWDFVIFATTDGASATSYASTTRRPPALRFLINQISGDSELGVFAAQALTAKSWRQPDEGLVRIIFDKMIRDASSGELELGLALERAEVEINALLRK